MFCSLCGWPAEPLMSCFRTNHHLLKGWGRSQYQPTCRPSMRDPKRRKLPAVSPALVQGEPYILSSRIRKRLEYPEHNTQRDDLPDLLSQVTACMQGTFCEVFVHSAKQLFTLFRFCLRELYLLTFNNKLLYFYPKPQRSIVRSEDVVYVLQAIYGFKQLGSRPGWCTMHVGWTGNCLIRTTN